MKTLDETVSEFKNDVEHFSGAIIHAGVVTGVLEKACGSTARRHIVLEKLTGKTSSKLLTPAEWYALHKFVLPYKPEGGHWTTEQGEVTLAQMCETIISGFIQTEPPPVEDVDWESLVQQLEKEGLVRENNDDIPF